LESTLVSTRSTVPDTLASAAARTFDATSPVSSFSVLPSTVCPPWDGSRCGGPGGAAADEAAGVVDEDEALPAVAAVAIAAALRAAVATTAPVTSLDRMPCMGLSLID